MGTTYEISKDTTFVIVKQATSAFFFLRSDLNEAARQELMSLAKSEDPSLNKVDAYEFIVAEDDVARYEGSGNIGIYTVDFADGVVTVCNEDNEPDAGKISHLDYGVYLPAGQPSEPAPVSETGSLTITKAVEGLPEDAGEQTYTFTVTYLDGEDGEFSTAKVGEDSLTFTDGSAAVDITGAGSVTITGLPVGGYRVSENAADPVTVQEETYACQTAYDAADGAVQVEKDQDARITVTNTHVKNESQGPQEPQEPTPVEHPKAVDWDLSKSKEATNLDENFESRVTLSLSAADYQNDLDVVFVLDGSTSSDKVDLTETAAGLLEVLADYKNLTVKVGVVIFGGYEPVLSTTELTTLDSTTLKELRDDVLTTEYNDMKDATNSYKLRSGSNLQAGVEAAREILNGDPMVAAEDKYMIVLSDGAARVWINESGESVAQLHLANNWNTTEDFRSRYVLGGNTLELRTFGQLMEEASAGHPIGAYAVTYEESKTMSTSLPADVNYATDPYYYSNVEAGAYYAARSMMEAASECHIIWTAYHWTTVGSQEENYVTTFRNWMAQNQYVTLYDVSDMQTEAEYQEVYGQIHDDLVQLVDDGSYVVDVIGNDVDDQGNAYNFDFVNDISKLTLTVGGRELAKTPLSETSYGFGDDGEGGNAFVVTYYKDGAEIHGKTYDECFLWEINVPVTKDAPVQLTYAVQLTNPQTAEGSYGVYDRFGENHEKGLYTNNSATLFPVDSNGANGSPEDFNKPTVDYTVTPSVPSPTPTPVPTPGDDGEDDTPPVSRLTPTPTPSEEPDEPGEDIPDGDVPGGDLPQTGAVAAPVNPATTASLTALAFSMAGCGLYFACGRKKGEEED